MKNEINNERAHEHNTVIHNQEAFNHFRYQFEFRIEIDVLQLNEEEVWKKNIPFTNFRTLYNVHRALGWYTYKSKQLDKPKMKSGQMTTDDTHRRCKKERE